MKTSSVERFVLITAILVASTTLVFAQSGRRGTPKSPVPPPPSASETKTTETKTNTAPQLELAVGIQEPGSFDGVPPFVADVVISTCVGRLNEAVGVRATVNSASMTRNDAIKLAKSESRRYVVWLEIHNEAIDASRRSGRGDNLLINYVIYEPVSAKVKAHGRAQYGLHSSGPVGVGLPPNSGAVYSDYAIKEAARQAAEKVLSAFEITTNPSTR